MRYSTILPLATAMIAVSSFAARADTLTNSDVNHMSVVQKQQAQKYFRAHSFDFPKAFGRYHPGPYWILHHASAFHLTKKQTEQETMLKLGMAKSTIMDDIRLKNIYAHYVQDSKALNPSSSRILADISSIGKEQTILAKEMIPYHVKGYNLLNSTQRKTYQKLVRSRN